MSCEYDTRNDYIYIHYWITGINENRIISYDDFLSKYPDFNIDLSLCDKINYIKNTLNSMSNFIDIKKAKIAVIYVYYERKNEQKNQTNLSFFIKYGLNKNNWLNLDITYLFVINGHQCEIIIPNEKHIHILKYTISIHRYK
jgi:hypothetical protein